MTTERSTEVIECPDCGRLQLDALDVGILRSRIADLEAERDRLSIENDTLRKRWGSMLRHMYRPLRAERDRLREWARRVVEDAATTGFCEGCDTKIGTKSDVDVGPFYCKCTRSRQCRHYRQSAVLGVCEPCDFLSALSPTPEPVCGTCGSTRRVCSCGDTRRVPCQRSHFPKSCPDCGGSR